MQGLSDEVAPVGFAAQYAFFVQELEGFVDGRARYMQQVRQALGRQMAARFQLFRTDEVNDLDGDGFFGFHVFGCRLVSTLGLRKSGSETLPMGLQRADPLPFLCSPWPGVLFSKKRVLNDFIFA